MTYKKILVPYDGSKQSGSALRHAVELDKMSENNPEIILLYVIEKILLPPSTQSKIKSHKTGEIIDRDQILKEVYFDQKESAIEMLEKAKQLFQHQNVSIRPKVLYGYPADEIITFAKESNVDLIVIGNIGLSGISRLKALGSVSRAVAENARCPVLIVH